MKIPAVLPITALQSRGARFQLGLTQGQVIEESGVPGWKLKQFESGRIVPDIPSLEKLAAYYKGKGIDLSEVDSKAKEPAPAAKPGGDMVRNVARPCFYISDSVSQELLDQCLERMHFNDERIAVLMKKPIQTAFLGGYTDDTVKEVQELFGALAEGYMLFRLLQGNPLVQPVEGAGPTDPKSLADLVAQFYAKSPVHTGEQPEEVPEEPAKPAKNEKPAKLAKPAEEVTE
jgi:transcriptional regulator with XRE-family HTH domain